MGEIVAALQRRDRRVEAVADQLDVRVAAQPLVDGVDRRLAIGRVFEVDQPRIVEQRRVRHQAVGAGEREERMVLAGDDVVCHHRQLPADQARMLRLLPDARQDHVEPPLGQVLVGLGRMRAVDLDHQPREGLLDLHHRRRQDQRPPDRPGADAQRDVAAHLVVAQLLLRQLPVALEPQRGRQHLAAEERRSHAARMPLEQRPAEQRLELRDGARQGRLRDVQPLGRLVQAAFLDDRLEAEQMRDLVEHE
ncbi:MAG: hypothetical protein BGN94_18905 [Rhizobiales bacterium 68-8]|nr:MAG: hypothetical protein BGN94_18905 [Rhizobiales bacterium 68-8]